MIPYIVHNHPQSYKFSEDEQSKIKDPQAPRKNTT